MYVFYALETEQGIQVENWSNFVLTILCLDVTKNDKMIENYNTCVVEILVLYDNRKSKIYKVLGVVVYWNIYKYVCIDHLCIQKEKTVSVTHSIWRHCVWWDFSNWNYWNVVENCDLL